MFRVEVIQQSLEPIEEQILAVAAGDGHVELTQRATALRLSTSVANKVRPASSNSAFISAARMCKPRSAVWSNVSYISPSYHESTTAR